MKLYPLAIAAGLLPLVAIHLCYLLAAANGHVPWCLPYIDSCTSISAAGRYSPEFFVFKGLMIPAAVVIGLYWLGVAAWLRNLLPQTRRAAVAVLVLTWLACCGLILYSVMLGAIGDAYRMQRRLGVITFFTLTFCAQVIVAALLNSVSEIKSRSKRSVTGLWAIVALVFLSGVLALSVSAYDEALYDSMEYSLEWIVTLLLCLQPLLVAAIWAREKLTISLTTI